MYFFAFNVFSCWIFAYTLFKCEHTSWPQSHKTSFVSNDLSSKGIVSWWPVVAVDCLRGQGFSWTLAHFLFITMEEEVEVEGLCVGMGEERWGGMSDSLTDLGERLLILLEGCTTTCFTQNGGTSQQVGRRRASSKRWRISVQSSPINIGCLLPFYYCFSLFFFLSSDTRTGIWGTLHAAFVQSPAGSLHLHPHTPLRKEQSA